MERSPVHLLLLALVMAAGTPLVAQPAEWFGFTPYPGTRELCSQSVRGQGGEEILWHMHAAKDTPAKVAEFYVKNAHPEVERKDGSVTLRRGDTVLTVQAAGSDHPECGRQPSPDEKTVIVISRMNRPRKE